MEQLLKDVRQTPFKYGKEFVNNVIIDIPIKMGIAPSKKESWLKKLLKRFKKPGSSYR